MRRGSCEAYLGVYEIGSFYRYVDFEMSELFIILYFWYLAYEIADEE